MDVLVNLLTAFVAFQHFAFMILEIFYWNKPLGMKVFRLEKNFADQSAALASNMGIYNGFLASGLVMTLITSHTVESYSYRIFFLVCVFVAGVFGAITVNRRILFIQGVPALLTLILFLMTI